MNDLITQWLTIVAGLVSPANPADALQALIAFKPHIRAEFQPTALTAESARAVAEAKRFGPVPDWSVIAGTLREFARNQRPINALPGPPDQLTSMDRAWVKFWNTRQPEINQLSSRLAQDEARENLGSLIRQQSHKAWHEISGETPRHHVAPSPERTARMAEIVAAAFPTTRHTQPAARP